MLVAAAARAPARRITDDDYAPPARRSSTTADEVWGSAELVLKVKEPIAAEFGLLRADLVLFTYLHLAAYRPLAEALLAARAPRRSPTRRCSCPTGALPLLAPMSEVAGRLAPQVGAPPSIAAPAGRGVLHRRRPGRPPAKVVVLGAGVAGMNAAGSPLGMEAEVLLLDKNIDRLRAADRIHQGRMQTLASNAYEVERAVLDADLVIGAVLVPGAKAPMLVTDEHGGAG